MWKIEWTVENNAVRTCGQIVTVGHDSSRVFAELTCAGRETPLRMTAPAVEGDSAAVVMLPHRVELYVNGKLMDEEWPTAYALPEDFGGEGVSVYAEPETVPDTVLGEFENAEGWRPGGGVFVGDCMPYCDGERYHVLYLKDRHHHRSKWCLGAHQWAHISTDDFVHWQIHPMAVPVTSPDEGSICTGSWIRCADKQYLYYTVRACDGGPAPIRRSVSEDGYHFVKDPSFDFTISGKYTRASARDPKVFFGADGRYHMFLTSTLAAEKKGCLVHLVSDDADRWTELDDPIYISPDEDEPECCDYFSLNGWYYLIFSHRTKGEYRFSDQPFSGWKKPEDARIPCKTVPKMAVWNGRILFAGFDGGGLYAGTMTFMESAQNEDGTLRFFRPEG